MGSIVPRFFIVADEGEEDYGSLLRNMSGDGINTQRSHPVIRG